MVKHRRLGFTLVEILLSLIIIGVGVFPVLSVFLQSARTVEKGGIILAVSVAAQNLIDTARSDSFIWAHAPCTINIPKDSKNFSQLKLPEILQQKYQASATVVIEQAKGYKIAGTSLDEDKLYQVTVTVKWVENGLVRSFRLLNYRAAINSLVLKTSSKK